VILWRIYRSDSVSWRLLEEQFIPTECQWSEIASVRSIETRNDGEEGIQNLYPSPTTVDGGEASRDWYTPTAGGVGEPRGNFAER